MKKLVAIIMLIALALSCVACNGGEGNDSSAASDASNTATGKPVVSDTMSDDSSAASDDSSAASDDSSAASDDSSASSDGDNVFINNDNNYIEDNALAIRPKNVYWDNGRLVAVCFVANGYNTRAEEVTVKKLVFKDGNGNVIADATFGLIENLTVGAKCCKEWAFVFTADTVKSENHDLSHLICTYDVHAEHAANNVFINDNNNAIVENEVVVKPKQVYWEGDKLIAQCFVINGVDAAVRNIDVDKLVFEDGDGNVIASGKFGILDGLVIDAGSYAVWTFVFSDSGVLSSNHELSYLECGFDVYYD